MSRVEILRELHQTSSVNVVKLCGAFDVPFSEKASRRWSYDLPIEDRPWNVGLIVGPSGCGKSLLLKEAFGGEVPIEFGDRAIIDELCEYADFDSAVAAMSSTGFNTIPSWIRPYRTLSNGEQFRARIAAYLLRGGDPVVIDEFTSVVDRQVAKIVSHAVAKRVRKVGGRLVVASCHEDIVEWLNPDWIVRPAIEEFSWRLLQPRPRLDATIERVDYSAWRLFAPYHYLTSELHRAAACWVLKIGGVPASFAGILPKMGGSKFRNERKVRSIVGVSRLVTLPDYQGLGLAMILCDFLGEHYRIEDRVLRMYPAHPSLISAFLRSSRWKMILRGKLRSVVLRKDTRGKQGNRPNWVFEYIPDGRLTLRCPE